MSTLGGDQDESSDSALVLDRLVITGGLVGITDLSRPAASSPRRPPRARRGSEHRNIDLRLDGYAPRKPFDIELAASLPAVTPGASGGRISLNGTAGPVDQADASRTPFDGTVSFENASPRGPASFAAAEALDGTDAVITGGVDIANADGRAAVKGTLTLDDVRVRASISATRWR